MSDSTKPEEARIICINVGQERLSCYMHNSNTMYDIMQRFLSMSALIVYTTDDREVMVITENVSTIYPKDGMTESDYESFENNGSDDDGEDDADTQSVPTNKLH